MWMVSGSECPHVQTEYGADLNTKFIRLRVFIINTYHYYKWLFPSPFWYPFMSFGGYLSLFFFLMKK